MDKDEIETGIKKRQTVCCALHKMRRLAMQAIEVSTLL
jgi:hypothetical protein